MRSKISKGILLEESLKETRKGHASDFLSERYREVDGRRNVTFNGLKWDFIPCTTHHTTLTKLHFPSENMLPGATNSFNLTLRTVGF